MLVAPDSDRDPDAPEEDDESSSLDVVLNADTGTVVEPCCTINPLEPILTTSPCDKVTTGPPREMMVPSIVAMLETSAAWYAVTALPLTVNTIADAGVAIAAAEVPSTTIAPPDARLTREPSSSVWTGPPAVSVWEPMTASLVDPGGHDAVTVLVPTTNTMTLEAAADAGATVEYLATVEPILTPSLSALTTDPSSRVAAKPPGVSLVEPISTTPDDSCEKVWTLFPTVTMTALVITGKAVIADARFVMVVASVLITSPFEPALTTQLTGSVAAGPPTDRVFVPQT